MAKVLISVDTKENTYEVTVNGEAIANVKECSVCFFEDKPDVRISSFEIDDNKDVAKRTTIMASKNDFVKEDKVQADIVEFMKRA